MLSLSVRNRGPAAYAGHLDGFTLLGAPPAGQRQASAFDQVDTTSRACAPAAGARDVIAVGGDLRVGPGRVRTFDAMFEVPRGSYPLRALYHDDDFPKCLSLPAVSYSSPACRPHARRPPSNIDCHFFEH